MRDKLIDTLVEEMREAENYYLDTEDDSKKWAVIDKLNKAKLTEEESEEFSNVCQNWGI